MFVVYVLRSERDGKLYTGCTGDLVKRLKQHNAGRVRSTRNRRPLTVIYTESFDTRALALAREAYFKTPEGGALKQNLVRRSLEDGRGHPL